MKISSYLLLIWTAGIGAILSSCSDFLDREPLTVPSNATFLSGEDQVRTYVNGLYMALPSQAKFGMGVRGEEKNSDNILSEGYNKRLNGEETLFSSNEMWETGYQNLRNVNYFFHYYLVPEGLETDDTRSLKGEVYFFRAYWHFNLLKNFGDIPIMDAFWDENATVAGLQIAQRDRGTVAKFILSDLEAAAGLLHDRSKYKGLRICKEAAMLLAMRVALYEGTWEKYHKNDKFAAATDESVYFLEQVMSWGDKLFLQGITLNEEPDADNPGDAYAHLFNQKDYSDISEVLFWKQYSDKEGIYHALGALLGGGVVDENNPAGVAGELVNTYLYTDGTPVNPNDEKFKNFNRTFENRDYRLLETVMHTGAKFRSGTMTRPMKVEEYTTEAKDRISPPYLTGAGQSKNVTGYHIRLGVDTTFTSGNSETGLVIMRYAEALLSYAEAAEELGKCNAEVLNKTLKPLRERAGVTYVKPSTIDPDFTNYGYSLTANMQEIRRERRVEMALQGYRFDDLMRWAGANVIVGKRGRGAYLGTDGVLYKSFPEEKQEELKTVLVDGNKWMDPLQELLPNGYQFNSGRDYLLPIPPSELELNKKMNQNPGW